MTFHSSHPCPFALTFPHFSLLIVLHSGLTCTVIFGRYLTPICRFNWVIIEPRISLRWPLFPKILRNVEEISQILSNRFILVIWAIIIIIIEADINKITLYLNYNYYVFFLGWNLERIYRHFEKICSKSSSMHRSWLNRARIMSTTSSEFRRSRLESPWIL